MSETHRLLHALVHEQGEVAWAHLWTSTLVLAAALLAARWRRLAPEAREAVLSLGLTKLVVPGTLVWIALRAAGWEPGGDAGEPAPLRAASEGGFGIVAIERGSAPSELPCLLALGWIAGAAAYVVARAIRRRRLLRELAVAAAPLLADDPLRRAADELGGEGVTILRGAGATPFTFGTRRPVIVLPAAGEHAPELERPLLAHELAHVRRRDDLRAGLTSLVAALFWFHPLVWVAARRLAVAREAACDRAATRELGVPAYLAALDHVCRGAIAPAGLTGWASGALRERIHLLMEAQHLRFAPRRVVVTIALLATAAGIVASALAAPPPPPREGDDYRLAATVTPRGEDWIVDVELDDPNGTPLVRPQLLVRPPDHATVRSTTPDGDAVLVKVLLQRRGTGGVRARVERDGELLFDQTVPIAAPGARSPAESFDPASPITFSLRDADIHEVLWTLARMAGLRLSLEDGVEGTVTIELQDVAWTEALDVLARTNALRWEVSGEDLVVSPADRGAARGRS